MIHWLRTLVTSEDDTNPAFISLVKNLLVVMLVILLALTVSQSGIFTTTPKYGTMIILLGLAGLSAIFLYFAFKGTLWPAKFFIPILLLISIGYFTINENGLHDVTIAGLPFVIFFASLLFGRKLLPFWTVLTAATVGIIGYADISGITPLEVARTTGVDTIAVGIIIILASAGTSWLLTKRFEEIILQAREDEKAQVEANVELQNLQKELEQRVAERTAELRESAKKIEKRATQLEAIADVSSSVASLQELDQLLPYITKAISERFDFYHAGIFLISDDKKYAFLKAANSDGGKRMLARQHRLRIGLEGVVGYAIDQKRARIALDVGEDAVYFGNPDLPATRSEMALPLIVGNEAIGALDVQSELPNAFSSDDIEVLTALGNQVAVAIQNARLFEQSQEALRELEATFQHYVSAEWRQFASQSAITGYRALQDGLEPITESKQEDVEKGYYKIPLTLRGATLGSLNVKMDKLPEEYHQEEITVIKTVADRLTLALESARLLDSSQRTAAKEQIISDITTKIGASVNMRNVLQTAVEELGHAIPGSEIVIQLTPKTDNEAKQ